jgi:hypothetical protein
LSEASSRPIGELVEEAAARLTAEQLRALAARVESAEMAAALEATSVPKREPFDIGAAIAFDLDGAVRHLALLWGPDGVGCDLDIVAAWVYPALIEAGVPQAAALAALERHCDWHPRTDSERERAVAKAMLDDGWTPREIAEAMRAAELVPC